MRAHALAVLTALLTVVLLGHAADAPAAITLADGSMVVNTDWSSPTAQVAAPPACRTSATAAGCRPLVDAAGSAGAPEDDLEAALARLAAAGDAAVAGAARTTALAILEGGQQPGRPTAYAGIPLLNWNAPAKVRRVPAGGTVDVREVRFPDHVVGDTWLLDFEDPSAPYTIRYHVSELGGTAGGELRPAPLLADGPTRLGSATSALLPLMPGSLATGTLATSRFTTGRGLVAGAPEATRLAEQVVEVRMPAPRLTRAVLDPSLRGGATSLMTLQPLTDDRAARAADALGFAGADPTPQQRDAAIRRLAATAPERQLWEDLRALPATDDGGFLEAARRIGAQDRALVDAMRTRGALPAGVAADPEADVTVVLQNNETYVSRSRLRPRQQTAVRVRVVNSDGFDHRVSAVALHDREPVLGADDWGRFSWTPAAGGKVEAGGSAAFTVGVPADSFTLWLGDADSGDQASTVVELERGPVRQTMAPSTDPTAGPLHQAMDAAGDLWISLSGIDAIARVRPGQDLATSERHVHLIPGGRHSATAPEPPLEPSDVAVDHRGMVWTTLALGNGIARVDPSAATDGTTAGVTVYRLPACGADECPALFGADPGTQPTRMPLQMEVTQDAAGDTLVWFTESNVDRIGLLRVAPDGRELGQTHFDCDCKAPLGLALDGQGDVWFTEGVSNRLGRLTPDVTRPYAAAAATLRHYVVPSGIRVEEPELSRDPIITSNPHSVTVDRRGLVWFTESATSKVGYLDPALARPGTSEGIGEIDVPGTDFGTAATPADLTVDRAGTLFWTDEYGDAVGVVHTDGPRNAWSAGRSLRPAHRRSLTDSPLVSPSGDLYFLEAGAGVLTRIQGVSAGNPAIAPRARVELRPEVDELTIEGLAEAGTVDVEVHRDGRLAARAGGVEVRAGAATVRAWADADALRPGDVVRIVPHGDALQAAFEGRVPSIAAAAADGAVAGRVTLGGRVPAGTVAGDDGRETAIRADGGFTLPGAASTVTWSTATPAATWVTRAAVTPAAAPSPAAPAPAPAVAAPAAAEATPAPLAPMPAAPEAPTACVKRWLAGGRPALLGARVAGAEACLGRPLSRRGAVRRYRDGLRLEVRSGRVVAMTVTAPGWSADGGLAVGAPAATVRASLRAARTVAPGLRRAVLGLDRSHVADVLVAAPGGRVRTITIREVARRGLDRTGRALLRGSR